MKVVFNRFEPNTPIPVFDFVQNRKMVKYYNRETQAALVSAKMLLGDTLPDCETPIFYAVGIIEREEYELTKIAKNSIDACGEFSNKAFIEGGITQISPLTQFKVLYNMVLCFISIEYGLTGDNAVLYASAAALINNALYSYTEDNVIIGSGKIYSDGAVESGFALISKNELSQLPSFDSNMEAIELFKILKDKI